MKRHIIITLLLLSSALTITAQSLPTIKITYNGNTASVTVPTTITDVDVTTTGSDVEITSGTTSAEYAYEVSGESTDGSLVINGSYKLTLRLNGITLHNSRGAAIDIECGKRIAVELVEGTNNTLSDSSSGQQKAAFYFTGHPEFEGGGTLNVTGNTKHAISSKEYLQLKKTTGTINILGAQSDGIHCGKGKVSNEHNYFEMKGGTVNISNIGSDGIDSDDFGVVHIKGGAINITMDSADATGIKADSILTVSGGVINMLVKGTGSNGIKSSYSAQISGGDIRITALGDGSKGLKCKEGTTTVLNGGDLIVDGGNIEVYSLGKTIITDSDTTKSMPMSIDNNFTQNGGEIYFYSFGPESNEYKVKGTESLNDGILRMYRAPWYLNPSDYEFDMSSFVRVKINDNFVEDYGNYAIGAFNGEDCCGVAEFITPNYGILRIRSNSVSQTPISFKLYDYETSTTYDLEPDQDVTFQSSGCYGLPSTPMILSMTLKDRLKCDVNEDGKVDISDIVAVINQIAGTATYRYADVNDDGKVDISDIVAIINFIAGQ